MSEDLPRVTAMVCNKANRNNSIQKTSKGYRPLKLVIEPIS